MMEIRLLGALELVAAGRNVDLGPAKQRTLLAATAFDAGRPVGADALIDRIWDDRPPVEARSVLHTYVARVRRVLERASRHGGPQVTLLRRPGGYELAAETHLVDLHRFRCLVESARTLDRRDPERAALLDTALGLWSGEALTGVAGAWATRVRYALEQQRLRTLADWADTELALGQYATVIERLHGPVVEHALAEPLAVHLLRALHLAGRNTEALDVYAKVRARIADELGADPGPALQDLYHKLLQNRPSTGMAPSGTPGHGLKPAQLPLSTAGFIGRHAELARLDAIAASAQPDAVAICAICGMAGIGKTTLAVHWARRARERFPDGQLYVNLRGFDASGSPMSPAEALRGFLGVLGVAPQRVPAAVAVQASLYRSLVADKRLLVLLDNARDAEQVRPLLPGTPGCMVVVTSRSQLLGLIAVEGAHPISLDLLSVEKSRELFVVRVGAERVASEADAVDQIVDRCARLPLASLAEELHGSPAELDPIDAGDPATDLRRVFSWSYRTLSEPAARLFRLLGLHPGPDFAVPAAASLAGQPAGAMRPLLSELSRAHLISQHRPGRYALHDLLRRYASELAAGHTGDRDAALNRLFDHYTYAANAAADVLRPGRPSILGTRVASEMRFTGLDEAIDWFTAERLVLVAVVRYAAAHGWDGHAWKLAWGLRDFLDRRRLWHEQIAVQRAGLDAARRLGDGSAQAYAHRSLGRVHGELGQADAAADHYGHALELFRTLGDHLGQAQIHMSIGMLRQRQKRTGESLHHHRQALELFGLADDTPGRANALNNIAMNHLELGDHEEALARGTEALEFSARVDDRFAQAATWDSVGDIHRALGQNAQAINCYRRSLELVRQVGDRYHEALSLEHLADAHQAMGDATAADEVLRLALDILDDLGHPDATRVRTRLEYLGDGVALGLVSGLRKLSESGGGKGADVLRYPGRQRETV